jgi:hypothetical protein
VQQFDAVVGRYVLIHQDDPPPFSGPPDPEVYGEVLVAGRPDSPGGRLVAETARSPRPAAERIGVRAEEVDVDTLESRLRAAVAQAGAQLTSFPQYMAIARV